MPTYVLVGNPNSGKTTLFNALTGLRQKVGNYPGVTVERKEGIVPVGDGKSVHLIDLPGLYSLTPHSPDERIARDALLGYLDGARLPDAIVNVVDASNLERNLYLTSQLLDLGLPVLIVLTMTGLARRRGIEVDPEAIEAELGVPVRVVDVTLRQGLKDLVPAFALLENAPPAPANRWGLPVSVDAEARELADLLHRRHGLTLPVAFVESVALLGLPDGSLFADQSARWDPEVRGHLAEDRRRFEHDGIDVATAVAEARYADIGRIATRAVRHVAASPESITERIDRFVLHRFWGYVIFLWVLLLVFQSMFTWAKVPADYIQMGVDRLGTWFAPWVPEGDLRDLVVSGVFGGVGNTVVFLPQILLLFLFISLLEDTGYLARAAFLMDRLMSRVGLHGKSFIPLLSSYACAIPGIMATRTIESPRARLLTILVAPLMSCSARLPVYALMIGAFIPDRVVAGVHVGPIVLGVSLPTLTLTAMYAIGTIAAFAMAAVFNRTLLKGDSPSFLMEMPPYRAPNVRTVVVQMLERAWLFLKRAGTVILAISIVLWFLSTYPKHPDASASGQLEQSYAGRMGRFLEPAIRPLGFDARMGIGLVASFAAREVFVTAMGTIYNIDQDLADDETRQSVAVAQKMRAERDPRTGEPVYTPLVAVCLMVYYVLAMQCMSTIAVVRRETNGWKWPLFQVAYMTGLAWGVTFAVRQVGLALGYL